MRLTLGMVAETVRINLMTSSEALLKAQDRASSGKRIRLPSDDVVGTGRALGLRSSIASIEQYTRNTDIARNRLSITCSALDSIVSAIRAVRSLAMTSANASITDEAKMAVAAQLDHVSSEIADLANTQCLGKYIFAGSLSDKPPIISNPAGQPPYIYQGNSNQLFIRVGPGISIPAGVTGDMVLNMGSIAVPSSPDIFETIRLLKEEVLAGDCKAISARIADIDALLDNAIAVRSKAGASLSRLEATNEALLNSKVTMSELLSKTEDADLAEAIVDLRTRENVYQAAIATAGRIMNLTLADFLK